MLRKKSNFLIDWKHTLLINKIKGNANYDHSCLHMKFENISFSHSQNTKCSEQALQRAELGTEEGKKKNLLPVYFGRKNN